MICGPSEPSLCASADGGLRSKPSLRFRSADESKFAALSRSDAGGSSALQVLYWSG